MKSNSARVYIALAVVIIIVTAFIAWQFMSGKNNLDSKSGISFNISSNAQSPNIPISFDSNSKENKVFTHDKLNFTFSYPKNFTVALVPDDIGESVVVQESTGKTGFQINIQPFDEPGSVITPERIKADVGNIDILEPQQIQIADSSGGLAFVTTHESLGKMREIWFAYNGSLYQISTPLNNDPLLKEILSTWQFGK